MELLFSLASFVLTLVIIYYVIRKATRADEIIELLKKSLNAHEEVESPVVEPVVPEKSDDDYLREARAKAGV